MPEIRTPRLHEQMLDCVREMRAAGLSISTGMVAKTFQELHLDTYSEHAKRFENAGYMAFVGHLLKRLPPGPDDPDQLLLDLDLDGRNLPERLPIPADIKNPLAGRCEWRDRADLTVADMDAHLALLDAQMSADRKQRNAVFNMRQRVVQIIGVGSPLTLADAAMLARERAK